MVELERAVTAWQQEGTPEAQGAVIWRAAQVLWETAAIFKRHSGFSYCCPPPLPPSCPDAASVLASTSAPLTMHKERHGGWNAEVGLWFLRSGKFDK